MKTTKMLTILVLTLGLIFCSARVSEAAEMGTAFTYQGYLYDANHVADGLYDFQFKLYDSLADGNQVGSDVNKPDVDVVDGYFTVKLDFGSGIFDGDARWLEIGVRQGELEDPNAYTVLTPRQKVMPTPYALYAKTAGGDNDWMVSGNDMYSIPSGNVGIGTTSPEKKLDITSESYADLGIGLNIKSLGGTSWDINNDGGVFKIVENATCGQEFGNNTRIAVVGNCIGSPYGGNIGIGTTSPETKLHVYEPSSSDVYMSVEASSSDGEAGVQLRNPAGGWDVFANNGDGDFGIAHALSERVLTIKKTTGDVGIGTVTPASRLDVQGGDLHVSGSGDFSGSYLRTYGNLIANAEIYKQGALPVYINDDLSVSGFGDFSGFLRTYGNLIANGEIYKQGASPVYINDDLDVNGSIYQRGGLLHADYVFNSDYELESIDEHSEFMWQQKHLPAIPKAKVDEMGQEVVEVGAHRRGIVEELEKAHIYIEQLHKHINALEERLVKLESRLNTAQ